MKTRTLLLLSVAMGLAILLAGGVLLLQLSNEQAAVQPSLLGEEINVGDVAVTVIGAVASGSLLRVDVEIGGVDDLDGIETFRLNVAGQGLIPLTSPEPGRCSEITIDTQTCGVDFDMAGVEDATRTLVMVRGDDRSFWVLP